MDVLLGSKLQSQGLAWPLIPLMLKVWGLWHAENKSFHHVMPDVFQLDFQNIFEKNPNATSENWLLDKLKNVA